MKIIPTILFVTAISSTHYPCGDNNCLSPRNNNKKVKVKYNPYDQRPLKLYLENFEHLAFFNKKYHASSIAFFFDDQAVNYLSIFHIINLANTSQELKIALTLIALTNELLAQPQEKMKKSSSSDLFMLNSVKKPKINFLETKSSASNSPSRSEQKELMFKLLNQANITPNQAIEHGTNKCKTVVGSINLCCAINSICNYLELTINKYTSDAIAPHQKAALINSLGPNFYTLNIGRRIQQLLQQLEV